MKFHIKIIFFLILILSNVLFAERIWLNDSEYVDIPIENTDLYKRIYGNSSGSTFLQTACEVIDPLDLLYFTNQKVPSSYDQVEIEYWVENSTTSAIWFNWKQNENIILSITLINPLGEEITEKLLPDNISILNASYQKLIKIKNQIPGKWVIRLSFARQGYTDEINCLVQFYSDSKVKVNFSFIETDYEEGEEIPYSITISEDDSPIFNCNVNIKIFDSNQVELHEYTLLDNGLNNDEQSNDGAYSCIIEGDLQEGLYGIKTYVEGTSTDGDIFKREFISGFRIIGSNKK